MLSQVPVEIKRIEKEEIDKQALRVALIGELDAINLYEQLGAETDNKNIRKMFMDIAKEEKTHVGEIETLLIKLDEEQKKELDAGREEVEEMME